LAGLCPGQQVETALPDGTRRDYRWVQGPSDTGGEGRSRAFNALPCEETDPGGRTPRWAWATDLPVNRRTVAAIAARGGRKRWCIENEGFNTQKGSELRLGHAYSHGEEQRKAFYYLLQRAHLMLQSLKKGSLLRRSAAEVGQTPLPLFGSLKEMGPPA
jgi:hypothetical protein